MRFFGNHILQTNPRPLRISQCETVDCLRPNRFPLDIQRSRNDSPQCAESGARTPQIRLWKCRSGWSIRLPSGSDVCLKSDRWCRFGCWSKPGTNSLWELELLQPGIQNMNYLLFEHFSIKFIQNLIQWNLEFIE